MNHIHWMMPGQPTSLFEINNSNLASIRFRAGVALKEMAARNWNISMGEVVPETDVLVIGKIGSHQIHDRAPVWISQIKKTKAMGASIYLDYTDNHLGFMSSMSNFYLNALALVDYCVCPSEAMKMLLEKYWGGPIAVIGDPIEIDVQSPKIAVPPQRTALWFGHSSNIGYLKLFLERSFKPDNDYRIIALSNVEGVKWFKESNPLLPANVQVELGLWSVQSMLKFAQIADVCIIPSDISDARKSGVSANRLITAMALGLPIAADRLPAYVEYSEYFIDIRSKDFYILISDPQLYIDLTLSAQTQVVPKFSLDKFGVHWSKLLAQY